MIEFMQGSLYTGFPMEGLSLCKVSIKLGCLYTGFPMEGLSIYKESITLVCLYTALPRVYRDLRRFYLLL